MLLYEPQNWPVKALAVFCPAAKMDPLLIRTGLLGNTWHDDGASPHDADQLRMISQLPKVKGNDSHPICYFRRFGSPSTSYHDSQE